MYSAFGIDHGGISKKKEKKASAGRHVTAQFFPGVHGLAAGKPGKGLKAAGHEVGGNVGGALAGAALGAATRKPLAIAGGTFAGQTAGTAAGVKSAQKKGYYRKEKKS